jgi:hypothetical protein
MSSEVMKSLKDLIEESRFVEINRNIITGHIVNGNDVQLWVHWRYCYHARLDYMVKVNEKGQFVNCTIPMEFHGQPISAVVSFWNYAPVTA